MSFKKDFNIFVGGKTGTFKGVKVEEINGDWKGISKNIQNLDVLDIEHEITTMSWGNSSESEVLLGLANQTVKIYDTEYKAFTSSFNVNCGTGKLCGVSRFHDAIFTAVESGEVKVWTFRDDSSFVIETGGPLDKMKHSSIDNSIIATGGKEKDLQLWNMEAKACTFSAKNVRPNALQLRVPVWVSDIDFLPGSANVAVCSRFGYVRLYDPNTRQRRPVIDIEVPDQVLTAMCVTARENQVMVGSGSGHMMLVDFRGKGTVTKRYKGSVGSIRSISAHPSDPYVVSVGLDRHIKLHHLHSTKLLYKEYLKSRLNCVLMRNDFIIKKEDGKIDDESDVEIINLSDEEEQEKNLNKIFDNMESIIEPTPKKKRKRLNASII